MAVHLISSAMYWGTTEHQRLGGGGQAQLGHVQQQPAGPAQTGVDAIAAIEMGGIDQINSCQPTVVRGFSK